MTRRLPRARSDGEPAFARDLADRPGFLIRRLHQIHVALFAEECGRFGVTPVQYSILTVVETRAGLEQARLAHEVGVDRTTIANVLSRLERRGLVRRAVPENGDRRTKQVFPTPQGCDLLKHMDAAARRAHERTVEALPAGERSLFLEQLRRLVDAGNEHGRAPLRLL